MQAATRLAFEPLLGWPVLWAVLGVAALMLALYAFRWGRAWLSRGVALALIGAALSGPALVEEQREPLKSVAALVLDTSESMSFGDRAVAAAAIAERYRNAIEDDPSLELRFVRSGEGGDGTDLFTALEAAISDVPRERLAGAVFITDGQVHDIPEDVRRRTSLGPLHGVVVGDPDRGDRRVEVMEATSFGIVGEPASFTILAGDTAASGPVPVSVSLNGGVPVELSVPPGESRTVEVEIERRGDNVVVVEAPAGREELTMANNRTAVRVSGVPDRLRVLLITGRPNQGGRTWRDLLKSDPSVDLVQFTILRPPFKNELIQVPENELALIEFPTEELFQERLSEFDLIIFDQYERRAVILMSYLANMARYVDEGGALMIVAGPSFAQGGSLARSPLSAVLPAFPTGRVVQERFVPELTDAGRRHPVTAGLDGGDWGGWLRSIESEAAVGDVLMSGPGGRPLLIVDRVGEGRVAQLMSDQIWLWARGYEGGGPYAELMRRVVHWMMKEPELEERRLTLEASGGKALARLRTLADRAPPLRIETPEGSVVKPEWLETAPGMFEAETDAAQLGLYRAAAGGLEAVTLQGPSNPREYSDLQSTTDVLEPLAGSSGGGVWRAESPRDAPAIRRVSERGNAVGAGWLGLRERGAYAVRSATSRPLLPGIATALLLVLVLLWAWRREGA